MKNLLKFTNEQIESFILGVQETFVRGDLIAEQKELEWKVAPNIWGWQVLAKWIKEIEYLDSEEDPQIRNDDKKIIEARFFHILKGQSQRKICAEIIDILEEVINN